MSRETEPVRAEQEQFSANRVVVKIGSKAIEGPTQDNPLNLELIDSIAQQCSHLFNNGVEVIIVSSGAVTGGRNLLSLSENDIKDRQVEALYGQPTLIGAWVEAFRKYGVIAGQALITKNDLPEAQKVLSRALRYGTIIINWNDAISSDEMRQFDHLADNDNNAKEIAKALKADLTIFLTNEDGVLDSEKKVIEDGLVMPADMHYFSKTDEGTGGMVSKVKAGTELAANDIRAVIAKATRKNIVLDIARGNTQGCTAFKPRV